MAECIIFITIKVNTIGYLYFMKIRIMKYIYSDTNTIKKIPN